MQRNVDHLQNISLKNSNLSKNYEEARNGLDDAR